MLMDLFMKVTGRQTIEKEKVVSLLAIKKSLDNGNKVDWSINTRGIDISNCNYCF